MVRELGVDAAEARIKEAAQVIAPKTDTANKTDVRFFIRKSLVLEHEFAVIAVTLLAGPVGVQCKGRAIVSGVERDRPTGSPRSASAGSCRRPPTKAARRKHRTRDREIFRDTFGDRESSDREAGH